MNIYKLVITAFIITTASLVGFTKTVVSAPPSNQDTSKSADYGVRGHLFEIEEVSIQEEIMAKLHLAEQNGQLKELQDKFVEKVKKKILNPVRVENIKRATVNRQWTYDPSYVVTEDIVDHRGVAFVLAGSRINPLDKLNWGECLIFIDGTDTEQVEWARQQKGKVTLIDGAPLTIAKILDRSVFFDQAGLLSKKFSLENVPAIVEQEGKVLCIREIRI